MQRLSSLILAVVGVLYPFIVYFGMEHMSTPLFAMLLGAIWLIRAPALMRQPGGRWMLGAALVYCMFLAVSGESVVLRWYPSLICALLLCAFGLSLRYGPPMIERIARVTEPDLPPAAVRYTRKVTWVWAGFFAFNAITSGVLAVYSPLNLWTLYNGIIAYSIMGVLFAGEWLLRQRLRRRISDAPMNAAAQRLATHPWVEQAHAGYAGKLGAGMVVLLSAAGRMALLRHGRKGLVSELSTQAVDPADTELSAPRMWRFPDALPSVVTRRHVDTCLRQPLPVAPVILAERSTESGHVLELALPLDLACFADHFPEAPVLPGVVQVGWALDFAAARLGTPRQCRSMDALKFQSLLRPGDRVDLELTHDAEKQRLTFAWRRGQTHYSSARMQLETVGV
ncbi:putative membrane protein/3-hydroxymyristoyl/3-hydroxydecanoyl-(acyl carrier protein) dehydratase [Luteibacter sp. Sphag1AF]|uniref:ApeI family dehydratase n=1 Tax=Luteibacter sp. Sphag1AF TaxID=2587031 RepID=UPI0017A797C6|nr:hypothetical protein [Luteibacter sp. Sphag1AF]MBB3227266.1 putative membrane protein/3-hydroxymyristoyl/3-hydroxydecanoyl-(acyl carrier protein) dehydratase [Luteibacter sp. Sphag1AF]